MEAMAASFRILGPLEVFDAQGTPIVIGAPKVRALLLCLLLEHGTVVSAERLIDAVWDGRAPKSSSKLLQLYVSNLRKALGAECIRTSATGYGVFPSLSDQLDSARFDELLTEARALRAKGATRPALRVYQEALSLWRGKQVAAGEVPDLFRAESSRIENQRIECLEERLTSQVTLGHHRLVATELAALCEEEPLREHPRAQLMIALYRDGRQADALEAYRDFRRTVHAELGLEPSEHLRELEQAILRHDSSLANAAVAEWTPRRLPTSSTPLIGRDEDLRELDQLLSRPSVRLISLVGPGGIGKTRAALAAAAAGQASFADGVVVAELAAARDPRTAIAILATALGVTEHPGVDRLEAIIAAVAELQILFVLDNFEQIIEAGPMLVRLLMEVPGLKILVTSRRVLHLSGEHVYLLPPLNEEDAVELFVQRAYASAHELELSSPALENIRSICRRLDGLPLAIELASARLRLLTPHQLLERLSPILPLLSGGPRDMPARQQTLRDTLAWSVDLLTAEEKEGLADLSVFVGGCSLEAAARVVTTNLDRLETLVDHNLVRRTNRASQPRFEMLETIREYAAELLGERAKSIRLAHAHLFAELAEHADLTGPEQPQSLVRLDEDRENLNAALDFVAASGARDVELRLVGSLWRYWWLRGELVEGRTRLESALARSDGAEPALVAQACRGLGGLCWNLGDAVSARRHAETGLQLAAAAGEQPIELACHTVLGLLARDESDFDGARAHFERSAHLARALGSDRDVMVANLNLGSVAYGSGAYLAAQECWLAVLAYHRQERNDEGTAIAVLNLGLVAYHLNQIATSVECFGEARALFDQLGFHEHHAHALQGLAALHVVAGEAEQAARLLGEAGHILETTGSGETTFDATLAQEAQTRARAFLGDERYGVLFDAGITDR
jgi:predicted ATPase/DNA-binding SARP family transcriptional activator